jgi:hypothetical protein
MSQHNKVVHILAYLSGFDIAKKPNGGSIPKQHEIFPAGDFTSAPIDAKNRAELYSRICPL